MPVVISPPSANGNDSDNQRSSFMPVWRRMVTASGSGSATGHVKPEVSRQPEWVKAAHRLAEARADAAGHGGA